MGIVSIRVHYHPSARGHLICQPDRSVTAEDECVGVGITKGVFNDMSGWEVSNLGEQCIVSFTCPNGLSNLCVRDRVAIQRYLVGRPLEMVKSRGRGLPKNTDSVGVSVVQFVQGTVHREPSVPGHCVPCAK